MKECTITDGWVINISHKELTDCMLNNTMLKVSGEVFYIVKFSTESKYSPCLDVAPPGFLSELLTTCELVGEFGTEIIIKCLTHDSTSTISSLLVCSHQ